MSYKPNFNISKYFAPTSIMMIVFAASAVLVLETGAFLNEALNIQVWRGYAYAIIVELISITLIEISVLSGAAKTGGEYILKKVIIFVLICIFTLLVGSSTMFAVNPILKADNISTLEHTKLAGFDKLIEAQQGLLDSVKGQRKNTAFRSQQLAETLRKKEALMSGLSPDAGMAKAGTITIILMILLRFILQAGSWLLAGIAGKLFKSKPAVKAGNGNGKKAYTGTPKQIVKTIRPDAVLVKAEDGFFVKDNGTDEILGSGTVAPLTWSNAMIELTGSYNN